MKSAPASSPFRSGSAPARYSHVPRPTSGIDTPVFERGLEVMRGRRSSDLWWVGEAPRVPLRVTDDGLRGARALSELLRERLSLDRKSTRLNSSHLVISY